MGRCGPEGCGFRRGSGIVLRRQIVSINLGCCPGTHLFAGLRIPAISPCPLIPVCSPHYSLPVSSTVMAGKVLWKIHRGIKRGSTPLHQPPDKVPASKRDCMYLRSISSFSLALHTPCFWLFLYLCTLVSSAGRAPCPSPPQNTPVESFLLCSQVCEAYTLPQWETE